MPSISGFVDDVMFSPNGTYTVARQQSLTSDPSPPARAISTRPQLAADDVIGWRGGWCYCGAGAKSAVSDCLVGRSDLLNRMVELFLDSGVVYMFMLEQRSQIAELLTAEV